MKQKIVQKEINKQNSIKKNNTKVSEKYEIRIKTR